MHRNINRRDFVATTASLGAVAGLGNFAFLNQLPSLSAQDVQLPRDRVGLERDVEPLVRLLEETPRNRILDTVAQRIQSGTTYQQLMTALMLAGVRGIQPRPVGYKFHAVLVVNSAHLASIAASDRERWLPLFWAIDNFKSSQARNRREGNWHMAPVQENQIPDSTQARRRFLDAMENWDEDAADVAVTSLVRNFGANEVIELFWQLGARDFRSIGHKAIYVANGWRTMQSIGWRHAEPVMRSLAYALLYHEGGNPAQRDDIRDRPGRDNIHRAMRIRRGWQNGRVSREAATDLLATLRTGNHSECSERIVTLLNNETHPSSIWDALFLMAGELLMRQPGIVGLHCVTTINAMYYGYQTSRDDYTRRYMMLQSGAFLSLFRGEMHERGRVRDDVRVDRLEGAELRAEGADAVSEIFADVSRDRMAAAQKTLTYLQDHPERAESVIAAARRLIFTRGNDSHDYKFSSAVLEDYYHTTPALRNLYLATGMFWLKGSGGRETDLYRRTHAALARS